MVLIEDLHHLEPVTNMYAGHRCALQSYIRDHLHDPKEYLVHSKLRRIKERAIFYLDVGAFKDLKPSDPHSAAEKLSPYTFSEHKKNFVDE